MPDDKPFNIALRFRLAFLNLRPYFPKILISSLLLINSLIILILLFFSIRIFILERQSYLNALNGLTGSLISTSDFWKHNRPSDLLILETGVISHQSSGQDDFYALIKNPNNKWRALVEYRFTAPGFQGLPKSGFILPEEEIYLLDLGAAAPLIGEVSFEITRLQFLRSRNWEERKAQLEDIVASEVNFYPGDLTAFPRTSFVVENNGAGSFWSADFLVVMFSGQKIIGLNTFRLEKLLSLTKRKAELSWFDKISSPTSTLILPHINVYDESVFWQPYSSP